MWWSAARTLRRKLVPTRELSADVPFDALHPSEWLLFDCLKVVIRVRVLVNTSG